MLSSCATTLHPISVGLLHQKHDARNVTPEARKMRLVQQTTRHPGCAFGMRRTRHRACPILDDRQAPAPLETTGFEDLPSRLRAHPLHKAMFALPRNALWLPGSLHIGCIVPFPRDMLNYYTRAASCLSITGGTGASCRPCTIQARPSRVSGAFGSLRGPQNQRAIFRLIILPR
jgi:hypothetical protein